MATLLAYPLLLSGGAVSILGSIAYNYIYSEETPIPTLTPHSMAPLPKNRIMSLENKTDILDNKNFVYEEFKSESIRNLIKD